MAPSDLLTVREVAERLQVARSTVLRWVHTGSIDFAMRMPSGALRFRSDDLEAWLAARTEHGDH